MTIAAMATVVSRFRIPTVSRACRASLSSSFSFRWCRSVRFMTRKSYRLQPGMARFGTAGTGDGAPYRYRDPLLSGIVGAAAGIVSKAVITITAETAEHAEG